MLSLHALLISSVLALPICAAPEPPTEPEPPAQPEPAPEPSPEPDPEPQPEPEPEPAPEPSADEPPEDPTGDGQSERERQLEEELAESRARAAELERMIDELRQQVSKLRAELAARPVTPPADSQAAPALPASGAQVEQVARPNAAPTSSSPRRSWDEDPSDSRPSWTPPPAPTPPMVSADSTSDPVSLLAAMRSAYAAKFPTTPNPSQRDAFDAFTGDIVKWSATQQRSLRLPVTWSIRLVRVEKGSTKDRLVRFIARSVGRSDSRGSGETFVVRVPRSDADALLQGDYRSATYEVTGTLAPIVRFAPERPYDGISSTHSAFVGAYCEVAIAVDAQSIRPKS